MGTLNNHPVATAIGVLLTAYLARFFYRLVQWRRRFKNLPGPPHHPVFGHLIAMGEVVKDLPKRVHPHVFPRFLREKYNLPPIFYIDTYPIGSASMMIILDPEVAQHVATSGLHKHPALRQVLAPLAGNENLVVSDGIFWKKWRTIFNPSFAVGHLMTQVPVIVDCAEKFVRILDKHASQNTLFRMEEEATRVAIDVIGRAVCDHDFKSLSNDDNQFVKNMRNSLRWCPHSQSLNPFHVYNPLRPLMFKYYKWRMDTYIGKVLDDRFSARNTNHQSKTRKKSGIDLALEEYFKDSGQDSDSKMATMDAEFRRYAIDNILVLLFAGHDTTASTICYSYHLLAKNPDKLEKLRKELDDIFGTETSAAEQLRQNPYIINKCEYTLAVIKEALRLWSPASTIREGRPDYFIKDPITGNMLPTDGVIVWPTAFSIHRDPEYFPDVDCFIPERFMPGNIEKMTPNAYRPFEKGSRNCIGQELALIEMKIVLALTVREFDVRTSFDQLNDLEGDGSLLADDKNWKTGIQECFGDEMYQVMLASAKPREGMPARVRRRNM